ncbi:MAG: type II toxin-antitoxin system HicA family toxin [Mycobacteriales bacterium]
MPRLPAASGAQVVKALMQVGFVVDHVRSSHYVMYHADGRTTTVPVHGNRDIPRGTLRGIVRQAQLTVAEFLRLL